MNLAYVWFKICTKLKGIAVLRSAVSKDAKLEAGTSFIDSTIGRFSYCGYNCFINNTEIGSFCSISDNVSIGGGTHPISWISTSPAFYKGRDSISKRLASLEFNMKDPKTTIGHDVWIGRGASLKAGITIGDGAIIAFGSVVTKNVPPYAVVGGNPAKVIRYRFEAKEIERLESIQWWNYTESKLVDLAKNFDDVSSIYTEKFNEEG